MPVHVPDAIMLFSYCATHAVTRTSRYAQSVAAVMHIRNTSAAMWHQPSARSTIARITAVICIVTAICSAVALRAAATHTGSSVHGNTSCAVAVAAPRAVAGTTGSTSSKVCKRGMLVAATRAQTCLRSQG